MTAQEYLEGIERQRLRIAEVSAKLDALYKDINFLPGVSYDGIKVQISTTDNRILSMIEEAEDRRKVLVEMIAEYQIDKEAREAVIGRLADDRLAALLTMRYVAGRYWWEISDELGVSMRTAFRLHAEALEEMERIMGGEK